MLLITPLGIMLAPKRAPHLSIDSLLVGAAWDGLANFEPAVVYELGAVIHFDFGHKRCDGEVDSDERNWLRNETEAPVICVG